MRNCLIIGTILFALIATASAETLIVGNYSISFDYSKPHEIIKIVGDKIIEIKTFDGIIWMDDIGMPASTAIGTVSSLFLGDILINNQTGQIWLTGLYLRPTAAIYKLFYGDLYVQSELPFMDTADFFKSLRIEKIKNR